MIFEIVTIIISLFLNYILIKNLDEEKFNLKKDKISIIEYFFILYNLILLFIPIGNIIIALFNIVLFSKINIFELEFKNIFKRFFDKLDNKRKD